MAMKFDDREIINLLDHKWDLESFEDVRQWDSKANVIKLEIEDFIIDLEKNLNESLKNKLDAESKIKEAPFLLRSLQFGKFTNRARNIKLIEEGEKERIRLLELKEQLEQWIDATPNNQKEANDVITELRLSKKQIDINKKEIQLQIKQINTDTKQKINKIENRVLFTSPKLKRLQKVKAEKKQDKAINPLEQSLMDLEAQEIEVDKMILWYEKIKYS